MYFGHRITRARWKAEHQGSQVEDYPSGSRNVGYTFSGISTFKRKHFRSVTAAFDTRLNGQNNPLCYRLEQTSSTIDPHSDKPGAYLEDSNVATDRIASHSSDPVSSSSCIGTVFELKLMPSLC